jgi:hypothetical protein
MNRFLQSRYLRWLRLCVVLLGGGALFASLQLFDWREDRTTLAQTAANCPKDIDVDLGGKLFRLPIVNNLSIKLTDESAKSLRPLRGEHVDDGEYPVVCKLALAGTPTPITSFGFHFDETHSLERANEQLSLANFCKNPQEYGDARLCREGFIKGDIEPSGIFLLQTNGSRYHPYVDALKASIGKMNPEEKERVIRRIGNVTEVKCCGTSDTPFYIMPPADLVQFDEMATIMQCSNFKDRGGCRAYGTFAGANLTYLFASPLRPAERFEELNNSVKALLERLEIK